MYICLHIDIEQVQAETDVAALPDMCRMPAGTRAGAQYGGIYI